MKHVLEKAFYLKGSGVCPVCGGIPLVKIYTLEDGTKEFYVGCHVKAVCPNDIYNRVYEEPAHTSLDDAIADWNERIKQEDDNAESTNH